MNTEDELNEAAALATGFQWRVSDAPWSGGCRFLCPPDTPEGNEQVGVNYPKFTISTVYPLAKGGEQVCKDWKRYMPRPCSDHGDALRLLEYTLKQVYLCSKYSVHYIQKSRGDWHVWMKHRNLDDAEGRDQDLPRAITLACIEALRAIGDGGKDKEREAVG